MAQQEETGKPAGISDEAVKARTGRTWPEWFAILDEAGAVGLGHRGIVTLLTEYHRVGHWWRQMITVAYEQERGLREKHQTPQGFQLSASKTIAAPAAAVFAAWEDEAVRSRWLQTSGLVVRKATPGKSVRATWTDGTSTLEVSFRGRGNGKSQVVVDHRRLADGAEVTRMKAFWSAALQRLKEIVEA
jgi:uncharacterized protein YndB with AHSA1/START domain